MILTMEKGTAIPTAYVEDDVVLTAAEQDLWEGIIKNLGATAINETPEWDAMAARYPKLNLDSRPVNNRLLQSANSTDYLYFDLRPIREPETEVVERILAGLRRL